MRNLKKVLSVLLVVAILATAMVPAFAADAATISADAKIAADIGMLLGDGAGVTAEYTSTVPTRIQAAIMLLRLKGLDKDAAKFTGTANFADVKANDWFAPYAAYLKANASVGFQGDEKGNLNPEVAITAQEYYKVVLTALGFEAGAGKDYDYEKTFEFAATKGLSKVATVSKFTVDSLAVATVEALKASVKGSTKTLIATLVDAGKVDAAKAEAAGIYKKLTQGFTVSNKAKSITVKFNVAPADATKVAITLTRDAGVPVAATADFKQDSKDKTVFTYTAASNLPIGEYKAAVKDDAADLGSQTLKITEEEKIKSIEIVSNQIIRLNETDGYVKYKVTNNYGDDVTKDGIATGLTWKSSLGVDPSADKGTLSISYNKGTSYLNQLKDYTTTPIVITGYDKDSAVTVTKTLTVSNTVGDIQSIKILGIKNKDNKTTINRGDNSNEFYLNYEIKDSNGELITNYNLLNNKDAFRIYPYAYNDSGIFVDPAIAAVEIVQDPNASKDALFKIRLKENYDQDSPYDGVGTQPINFIATQTGKTTSYNVEVKASSSELASFVVQRPSTTVTPASGNMEIPFFAYDSAGNLITKFDDINGHVTLRASHGDSYVHPMRDSNGNYKLFVEFNNTNCKADDTISITATVDKTFKYSSTTITVKAVTEPYEIVSTSMDTYLTPGASTDFAPDKFTVNDKNGNKLDLKYEYAKDYYIKAVSGDSSIISIDSSKTKAQGPDKIKVTAGDKTGSANITFTLYGPATPSNPTGKIADKIVTFRNVATKDITSYGIEAISTVYSGYASAEVASADSAITIPAIANGLDSKIAKESYRAEIKVRGYIGSQKILLRDKDMSSVDSATYAAAYKVFIDNKGYSVSDTAKFAVSGKYVYAIYDEAGTANVNATIYVDGFARTVSTTVTSTKDIPVAASVSAGTNDAVGYTPIVKSKGADFYEMTAADFNNNVVSVYDETTTPPTYTKSLRLTKYDYNTGNDSSKVETDGTIARSALYFSAKDQYGKETLKPTITLVEGTGLKVIKDASGKNVILVGTLVDAKGNAAGTAKFEGATVRLTATCNGVTKAITINVK